MNIVFEIFTFVFGLIIGSFLNAVIYRLYRGKSLMGFSACPRCRHRLFPSDLVPVLSFLYLGGRCRYCKKAISWQYPLVELATAVIFLFLARSYLAFSIAGGAWVFGLSLVLAALLIVIFTFDLRYYLIPDLIVLIGLTAALCYRIILPSQPVLDGIWGLILVSGFFGFLYLASRGSWIGLGDVKLGLFLGLLLGWKMSLVMLMLAYVGGALVGVVLILLRRKTMKSALPFGTFLTASSLVTLLWGERILAWYWQMFNQY
jgi:leader peptidase (prepilin peptidase)/N-methyltransferase